MNPIKVTFNIRTNNPKATSVDIALITPSRDGLIPISIKDKKVVWDEGSIEAFFDGLDKQNENNEFYTAVGRSAFKNVVENIAEEFFETLEKIGEIPDKKYVCRWFQIEIDEDMLMAIEYSGQWATNPTKDPEKGKDYHEILRMPFVYSAVNSIHLPKEAFVLAEGEHPHFTEDEERIFFTLPPVSIVVGEPNTGKSVFLETIHLMTDEHEANFAKALSVMVEPVSREMFDEFVCKHEKSVYIHSKARGIIDMLEKAGTGSGGSSKMFFTVMKMMLEECVLIPGGILVHDCAENNLHPTLQVFYAELLVRMAKEMGRKVIVSTNSHILMDALHLFSKKYELGFPAFIEVDSADNKISLKEHSEENLDEVYGIFAKAVEVLNALREELEA